MEQFLTSAEILENATALVPEIQRRAAETAALRRIPADLVEKLRAAGVFRVMFSKSWGGPEMPLPQQVQLMETLAYGDPSVAWAVKIGTDSGYFCAFLDTGAARELYPSIDFATAGQAPPNGRAVRVPGGYRVTGRWGFASGCTHADVMVAGCLTLEAETAPPTGMVFILAPASAFEIEDTWHSMGLAGSGSHHYRATNLFVPERHTFSLAGPARIAGPLYADAGSATVFIPMAGTPLGLMRRVIDVTVGLAGERVISLPPPATPMRHLPRVKFALARAQMLYGAARAAVYESVNRYWAELLADGHGSLQARRDMGLARIHAHRTAREVAQLMFDTVGAPAVYETLPLGPLLRDAIVINEHLGLNDGVVERLGGMMLGDSHEGAFV
ncbi:MAG TPA: acyl-CoA dehydrogenase family protein [Steroidobacteraceae bacterium]|nr:acyl-CoA dehydrogenase family protein [Steroidobacteraceae bacterium]